MKSRFPWLLIGGLFGILTGCGGGGSGSQAASPARMDQPVKPTGGAPPAPSPGQSSDALQFHTPAPRAPSLPHDPADAAALGTAGGFGDGAAVLVYADHQQLRYVLLGRRSHWLRGSGHWGVFGGGVDPGDTDDAGQPSFSRAAEHELYEESVSIYHQTDAMALRQCPSHLKTGAGGARYRTFFAAQPFIPETRFNAGAAYADQHLTAPGDRKYKENDQFLWVRLDDLIACSQSGTDHGSFTDPQGHAHTLQLWSGFWRTLKEADFRQTLSRLP
jgi:hypothetical protein